MSPDERRERVLALLRTYNDARETLQRGDAGGRFDPDSRELAMPNAWHEGDYAALEDALRQLRGLTPHHYWHLAERYIRSQRAMRELIARAERYHYPERIRHRVKVGEPLETNAAVLTAVPLPNGILPTRGNEPRAVLVRAVVERWHPRVIQRMATRSVDFVTCLMPPKVRLPRAVYETYAAA